MAERSTPGSSDWSESPGWGGSPGDAAGPPGAPGPGPSPSSWVSPGGPPVGPSTPGWAPAGPSRTPGGHPSTPGWGSVGPPPSPPGPPGAAPPGGSGGSWSGPAGRSSTAIASAGGVIGPPTWLLLIGLVVPIAALALTLVGTWPAYVTGWLLAVFGSVLPLAVFTRIDLQRRLSRWYVDRRGLLAALRVAVLVVGLVVACWFGYLIADQVARLDVFAG